VSGFPRRRAQQCALLFLRQSTKVFGITHLLSPNELLIDSVFAKSNSQSSTLQAFTDAIPFNYIRGAPDASEMEFPPLDGQPAGLGVADVVAHSLSCGRLCLG